MLLLYKPLVDSQLPYWLTEAYSVGRNRLKIKPKFLLRWRQRRGYIMIIYYDDIMVRTSAIESIET